MRNGITIPDRRLRACLFGVVLGLAWLGANAAGAQAPETAGFPNVNLIPRVDRPPLKAKTEQEALKAELQALAKDRAGQAKARTGGFASDLQARAARLRAEAQRLRQETRSDSGDRPRP